LQKRVKHKKRSPFLGRDPAKYEHKRGIQNIHKDEIACVSVLQNGNMISGASDASIKIWDPQTYNTLKKYEGHINQVTTIIELSTGNLASCSHDKTINIWDRQSGEILYTLEGFETEIK
jgi:WD40 repeat protein